jgi:hypothetical protein
MLDNAEKLMWKYLLERGGVIGSKSYYGTSIDFEKTNKCQAFIKEFGIDWKETKGVVDDYDHEFNGTFDDPAKVTFLKGTLVLNNGTKWEWYYEYYEPFNILELVKDIIPDPFEK